MIKNTIKILAASLVVFGAYSSTALSHQGATGIVKERMDVMSAIGKNMKAIGAMLNGKAKFDGPEISKKATDIAQHAETFPEFFKKQIEDKHTEASPQIWQKPEEFKQYAAELVSYAQALSNQATTANSADALKPAFKQLATTCKSCHETFRIQKKQ